MTAPDTIDIRQVSQLHAHWQEVADDAPGTFVLVAVLDDGAAEVVAQARPQDVQALIPVLGATDSAYLDLSRGVLIVGGIRLPIRGS